MKTRIASIQAAAILAVLSLPLPVRADYAIPVSATTEGGGTGTASKYELTYTIGQASPVGEAASVRHDLASGIVMLFLDNAPPAIIHQPVGPVTARAAVAIESEIRDYRSGVDTVILFFREGGLAVFRERPMLRPEGGGENDTYSATLPPSSVTERGLVYYIEARDKVGNIARCPEGAPDSLENLSVAFENLSGSETPAGAYRMISLPGVPSSGNADSVLADDLGAYDRKSWRLGRWDASVGTCGDRCYVEYPSLAAFSPGKAFWLVTEKTKAFDFSGRSADISRPYTVTLARGWNQIATPFCFPTDWLSAELALDGGTYSIGDVHVAGTDTILVEDNLISYDGAYHGFGSRLLPWSGYWIYNSSTRDVELRFDPRAPVPEAAGPSHDEDYQGRLDFVLEVSVGTGDRVAGTGLAGMSAQASDGWDALDLHEPPAVSDFLRVVFPKDDWGRHSGRYMADVRRSSPSGASWNLAVESTKPEHPSLRIASDGNIPEGWSVFLYDVEAGTRLDLASLPHSFDVEGTREFILVAGTDQFVATEESSSGVRLGAAIVSVVPNPFSRNVTLACFAPSRQTLKLQAFTVDGRLLRTIADGVFDKGVHAIVWDGLSSDGKRAAPGVYFIRLEAGRAVETRKVAVVD